MSQFSWDNFFLEQARLYSRRSWDPSTQCGAVIVDPLHKVAISSGYNGFARGYEPSDEEWLNREVKLQLVAHAEENAIANAARIGVSTYGTVLYIASSDGSFGYPCSKCAVLVVQAGIKEIKTSSLKCPDRWRANVDLGLRVLASAGVKISEVAC